MGGVRTVDLGLAQHAVVLELRLAERRGVASNNYELGFSGAEGLEGRLAGGSSAAVQLASIIVTANGVPIADRCYSEILASSIRRLTSPE